MKTFEVITNTGETKRLAIPFDWNAEHFSALMDRTQKPAIVSGEQRVLSGNLTAGLANAIAMAVANPEGVNCLITRIVINVVTAGGTGSSVLDVDVVAGATDTGDDVLDGINLNVTTTIYDSQNATDKGTNGDARAILWAADSYVTGKILVANASDLVGKYYIYYTGV